MGDGAKAISKAKANVWPKDLTGSTSTDPVRLMCFPHVDQASTKEIPKQYISDIKMDISQIQLSQTRKEFDLSWNLFKDKWKNIEDDQINTFLSYFESTWVKSKESNWFAGAGSLDHNNGLESKNGDLKRTKIIRPKQKIGTFYNNCKSIVYQESKLNDKEWRLFCDPRDLITVDD